MILPLPLRLAWRDLRGGMTGLLLLAVCLFLGVGALAAVGSLSAGIVAGLSDQGREILGGDIQVEVAQRTATARERAAFAAEGRVSHVVRTRAMLSSRSGEAALVELKSVDRAWPLHGRFRLQPGATARRPVGRQVALAPEIADRLGVRVGEAIRIGAAELRVVGIIAEEPDRIGHGFTLGATALVDPAGLAATGLIRPGSLYSSYYRIALPPDAAPEPVSDRLTAAFPSSGFEVRDRSNGAPGTRRFIERLGQFLTLVGLAALIIAGIGVGNGVSAYLEGKNGTIATLKMLGARSATIFQIYLLQIGLVGCGAILAGLAAGAAAPALVALVAGDALPVPPRLGLQPLPLLASAAYGMLIALVFALPPLARARSLPAASLFRTLASATGGPALRDLVPSALAAALLVALAVGTAPERGVAAWFIGAALTLALLLALIGWAVRRAAARLPRPGSQTLRMALSNLHRPGAQTGRLVVALGLGLTLFTTLAVIETNLARQIRTTIPARAPSFFLLDIPSAEADRFAALVKRTAPEAELSMVPSLRGAVVALGERRVADMADIPPGAWFLRGDRGLTFLTDLPPGNRVVEGRWWPPDYRGPPQVSLDREAARAVGLGVGDSITVAILGREVEARIASLREIDWDSLGFNFVIIFSPGALDAAPHSLMATVALDPRAETPFARAVTRDFPSVSLIRVKEVVESVAALLDQLAVAIRSAASVAILAGIAVLIGALAASRRARIYDSVILKMLGASRGRILLAQAIEFLLLAAVLALVALALGAAAGWYVVTGLFGLVWSPGWAVVAAVLTAGAVATLVLGLLGSLPALRAPPARALRAL